MNLQEKIAKARAALESVEPSVVKVELAGEPLEVSFLPISGEVWGRITATNPARPGAATDESVGYNTDGAAKAYPADRILVDGESVTAEVWGETYGLLSAPARSIIASTLWAVNQLEPSRRLAEAGKA